VIGQLLNVFGIYLIEFMGGVLVLGLIFRYLAFRQSRIDEAYYSSFVNEVAMVIEKDNENKVVIHSTENYLNDFMGRVAKRLPARSLRHQAAKKVQHNNGAATTDRQVMSLRDFVSSKQGLISSVVGESSIFNHKSPPNFYELTHRVMDQDKNWTRLLGLFPLDGISRLIDLLPNLFIVFGVFGTFIGISMALPEIARIDFNNLEASQQTLNSFVLSVTFSMNTSIAGIFFSLILTFLNTLFPIKEMRSRIFKKMENSFQSLWYHIHKEDREVENELSILKEILVCLKGSQKDNDTEKPAVVFETIVEEPKAG
jgi:hypothetical protein